MPCPYFQPVDRPAETGRPRRFPLIEMWRGVCRAGAEVWRPEETGQRELCAFGYARGRCPRLPDGAMADAVRFSVLPSHGPALLIQYVFEREWAPVEYGTIECRPDGGVNQNDLLRAQAQAFATSYLSRRGNHRQ